MNCPVTKKQRHASKGAAEAHRRSLLTLEQAEAELLVTFICPHCGSWHVGHNGMKRPVTKMAVQPKMKRGAGRSLRSPKPGQDNGAPDKICGACSGPKPRVRSLCWNCYLLLPEALRQELHFGGEEGQRAALKHLADRFEEVRR